MEGDIFPVTGVGNNSGHQLDGKILRSFEKILVEVQSILEQNRVLISEINQNQESKSGDNLSRNVGLIRELNNNIRRVVDLYADLSTNFTKSMAAAASEAHSSAAFKSAGHKRHIDRPCNN